MLLNCGVGEERFLRVPWTARRSNLSILKEISPECSLEAQMLKLKLQSFGHLMWRTDSFEKTLVLGKTEGGRRRGWQRIRWLDGTTNLMGMSLGKPRELVMEREASWAALHGVAKSWIRLSDWTELNWKWRNIYQNHHAVSFNSTGNIFSISPKGWLTKALSSLGWFFQHWRDLGTSTTLIISKLSPP